MSLKFLDSRSSESLSYALLWVHSHAVAWDLPCIQSIWKFSKSLDDETALQVLYDVYLNSPPTPNEYGILSNEYTNIWRCWIGDKEIEELYRRLLRTFPDKTWVATSPKINLKGHIDTFCSLHFGIEYSYSRSFTILTGLNKLAALLSPADLKLSNLAKEENFVADIKEGIAYTIHVAMTARWSGTRATDPVANARILSSGEARL